MKPAYEMRRRHHKGPGPAGAMPDQTVVPPGAATTAPPNPDGKDTTVVGQDWTSVVIARDFQLPVRGFGIREATTPVSGAWGQGRLLHTALANVLFLSDGRVAAGFVNPTALEAAVAAQK